MPTFINPIFNALCDIARSDDRDEPLQRKCFHALLRDRSIHQGELATEIPHIFYTPVSLLASEGNDDGVDFLLRHGANKNEALEGYAAGGYFAQANTLLTENFDSLTAIKGYARGGHIDQVDALLSKAAKGPHDTFLSLLKEALYSYAQSGFQYQVDGLRAQFDSQIPIDSRKSVDQRIIDGYTRGNQLILMKRKARVINTSDRDITVVTPGATRTTYAPSFHAFIPLPEYAASGIDCEDIRLKPCLADPSHLNAIIKAYAKSGATTQVDKLLDKYCLTQEQRLSAIRAALQGYGHNAAVRDIERLLFRYQADIPELATEKFLKAVVSSLLPHMKTHDQLLQMAAIIHHLPLFNAVIDHHVNQKFAHRVARRNELLKCVSRLREPVESYEPTKGSLLPFIPSASVLQTYLQDRNLRSWSLTAIGLVNTGRINYEIFFIIASYVSHISISIAARKSKNYDENEAFRLITQTHSYRMAVLASRMREATTQSTTLTPPQKTLKLSWITEDQIRRSRLNQEAIPSKEERDNAIKALSRSL